ncbi:DoxX family protein [Nocardioides ginsengisegetis]
MNGLEITTGMDVVLLLFRGALGIVMFLHGYNHLWGPGGLEGTARWFGGLGFRPAKLHAFLSGVVELAIAVGLVFGFLFPLSCAALIGVMVAAGWTDHRPNGFFMFRNGYEYVLVFGLTAVALAAIGPGSLSFDSAIGLVDYGDPADPGLLGLPGALIAGTVGVASGALLLVFGWREVPKTDPVDATMEAS